MAERTQPERLSLSSLSPAQPRKDRKRVGRGLGSGNGRYSGRGIKGQKSRAGSHMMRAGFEGGQMPLAMRIPKLRGNTSRDAMPIGPFRTYSQPVNIRDLARFAAGEEVTPETLKAKGLIRSVRKDVKLLGVGELTTRSRSAVHQASASAREKVEAAGGTLTLLKEPKVKKRGAAPSPRSTRTGSTAVEADAARRAARAPSREAEASEELGAVLARQRLAGSRAAAPGAVHRAVLAVYRLGTLDPGAGRQLGGDRRASSAAASSAC